MARWSWSTAAPSRLGGVHHRAVPGHDPWPRGQADLFDEIRLRLFPTAWSRWPADHRLVTLSPPAGGKAGSFLGVDEQVYSPSDFTPARDHQALARVRNRCPCRVRFRSRGTRPSLDRSGMLRRRPEGQLRRLSRCRADASRPGPRPLVHEMQLTPVPGGPIVGEAVDGGLWTPGEPGLPPAHQLPKKPKARAGLAELPVQLLRPTGVGQLLEQVVQGRLRISTVTVVWSEAASSRW